MNIINGKLFLSSRDLIAELECSKRLVLDYSVKEFGLALEKAPSSPELELLVKLGKAHEAQIVERLKAVGEVVEIGAPSFTLEALEAAAQQTRDAVASGVDTILQACLLTDDFLGFADFLILQRDDAGEPVKDNEGRFIYNPVDAKSARSEKRGAVLQVAAYAYAMGKMGLAIPRTIHLWLGGDLSWQVPASDVIDLAAEFLQRVKARLAATKAIPALLWEAPRESCVRCTWKENCVSGRRESDDLSLVQGIRASTRLALLGSGIRTVAQLAGATDEDRPRKPKEVSEETFKTLVAQADIQLRGRSSREKILAEPKDLMALGLLPRTSSGDIWFDMEGDPFAENGEGLEYMFGYTYLNDQNEEDFATFEAMDRVTEKVAFHDFIMMVLDRQRLFPDMHIYHYAAYEPSRMGILSQRHGVLEEEVDQLLRTGVFVDLYSIVRKAFRFSTDSMSIKYVEQIYQGRRVKEEGVTTAVDSVIEFEKAAAYLALGDEGRFEFTLKKIREYNKVDCDSTKKLDEWLREQATLYGIDLEAARVVASEVITESGEVTEPITAALAEGLPRDPAARTPEQHGLALLASAISFHDRESKPAWWNIFDRAKSDLYDLESYNDVVIASKVTATPWIPPQGRARNYRREVTIQAEGVEVNQVFELNHKPHLLYELAPEDFKTIQGSGRGFKPAGKIISISGDTIVLEESTSGDLRTELPMAILPGAPVSTGTIQAVLRDELGVATLSRMKNLVEVFPKTAWADLLLKRTPRQISDVTLRRSGSNVEDIIQSLIESDGSYVAVQGPPGTGKTFVGKHVIARLAAEGWKIGVTAQSHAVIENILDGVSELDPLLPIAKKPQEGSAPKPYHQDNVDTWANRQRGGFVIGGTVWSFSNQKVRDLGFDLMVIDEAGQFSLANTLVAASAANKALLLGDPQQLPQVSQATHPEPVEVSILTHLMGEHKTIPKSLGYFLGLTYRMHPALTSHVSQLQYDNRLESDPICSNRSLSEVDPGLHVIEVEHEGNTVLSIEEGRAILELLPKLIGKDWIDDSVGGSPQIARPIVETDVVVVAAFNRQVRYLKTLLGNNGYPDIRVGTVDKFQGQQAPIVIVSMATSSSEDLPRGLEFLLSPNRLNVAISRAKWVCYLVRSPLLSKMEPTSARGMIFLGKFVSLCRNNKNLARNLLTP